MRIILMVLPLILCGCGHSKKNDIADAVAALAKEDFGPSETGAVEPYKNAAVERVLEFRNAAMPELRRALTADDMVLVGYAAYCLSLLHDVDAVSAAEERLAELNGDDYRTVFARRCLRVLTDLKSAASPCAGPRTSDAEQ